MQRLVAIMMMAAAIAAVPAFAQEEGPGAGPARKWAQSRPVGGMHEGERGEKLKGLIDSLKLTDDQKTRVTQILETQKQDLQNFHKENGPKIQELEQAIRKATEAKDSDTVKAKREELAKIREARKAMHQKLMKQLGDVLNAEQMNKVRDYFAKLREQPGARASAMMSQLNLTEDQRKKAKEIMDVARAEARQSADPVQKEKIIKEAFEKIRTDVLTDEQRKQMEKYKERFEMFGMLKGLNLTDDQKKQIQAIREDTDKQLQAAKTPEERHALIKDALKQVSDKVLTPDQQKQLEEFREKKHGAEHSLLKLMDKLKLTDNQRAQIQKIMKEASESAKNATTPQDKREAYTAAIKKVHDEVLTDEQRAQLKELRKADENGGATSRPFRDRLRSRMQENRPATTKE